jgi:hypothetical protein
MGHVVGTTVSAMKMCISKSTHTHTHTDTNTQTNPRLTFDPLLIPELDHGALRIYTHRDMHPAHHGVAARVRSCAVDTGHTAT